VVSFVFCGIVLARNAIMNFKCVVIVVAAIGLGVFGCVSEEVSKCSRGRVIVEVGDKNYDNAAEIEAGGGVGAGALVVDENLPMSAFTGSLVVGNRAAGAGFFRVWEERVSADEPVHPLDLSRLSGGVSRVSVIGNAGVVVGADEGVVELHPSDGAGDGASGTGGTGGEGADIYVGGGNITLPSAADHIIALRRAKGLLIVDVAGLAADIATVTMSVSGVYATARVRESEIRYDGETTVSKTFSAPPLRMMLAPGVAGNGGTTSTVSITLTDRNGAVRTLSFATTIARNRISLVRTEYHPPTDTWQISTMIDGHWRRIEDININ
jgi:hypothetical protein